MFQIVYGIMKAVSEQAQKRSWSNHSPPLLSQATTNIKKLYPIFSTPALYLCINLMEETKA